MSNFGHYHDRNGRSPQKNKDFRQSMNYTNNEHFRNTIAFELNPPSIYRESVPVNDRFRNSLDMQKAKNLIERISYSKKTQKNSYNKLKNTLSELQEKLSKAKKQLSKQKNVLDYLDDDQNQNEQFNVSTMLESTIKKKDEKSLYAKTSPHIFKGKFSSQSIQTFPSMSEQKPYLSKIKTYYVEEIVKGMSGESKEAYQHLTISLKVIKSLPNFEPLSFMEIEERKVSLHKQKGDKRKTLVIDIDETIIHCEQDPNQPYDIALPIKLENGQYANAYISIRPYAISFLKKMSKTFQIIAFTASHESYADVVLNEIDPDREFIQHRLYRHHCFQIHPNIYTKDLRILNRDLSQTVLVDNAPYSYLFQLQNGIPILPFYKGDDYQLPRLEKYLQEISKCKDVRQLNKNTFQFHLYGQFQAPEQLAKNLYFKKKQ